MRVYSNAYELMSEIFREVWEMGHIVHPHSMQNKKVEGNEDFSTKEITNYSYCLTNLYYVDNLFFADARAKEWADAEIGERVSKDFYNPGTAWEMRKHIWEEFINYGGEFDYTYNQRLNKFNAIDRIIRELKINPDSRQAILTIWKASDIVSIGGENRVPCSIYYQLMVRDGKMNIIYNQRSADVVTHFGNDVYLAWKLMEYIAEKVGVKPGHLFHNIGSLHAYKKDWPKLKRCITDIKEQ